jgi:hypothetical protein
MKAMSQRLVTEEVVQSAEPVGIWAERASRVVSLVYEKDAELSRRLQAVVQRLEFAAADLACIGTEDPSAPQLGAATSTVVPYLLARFPELEREFRQVFIRVDQLLGRHELRRLLGTHIA